MNNNLKIEQIHKIHLEMLIEVTEFLNQNNIEYFIDFGTLIGAIRHKGFIPWDDDVDISMTRPEYEKFLKLARSMQCKISNELLITEVSLNNSVFPYCKIVNKKYRVKEKDIDGGVEEYLWIDVFPYDGLSNDMKKNEQNFNQLMFWKKIQATRIASYRTCIKNTKNILMIPAKIILKFFLNMISPKVYARKIRKHTLKYDFDSAELIQEFICTARLWPPFKREHFNELIEVEIDNHKFKTFKEYDKHLRTFYGDYMKLPPEDQRATHLEDIWEIKDEK